MINEPRLIHVIKNDLYYHYDAIFELTDPEDYHKIIDKFHTYILHDVDNDITKDLTFDSILNLKDTFHITCITKLENYKSTLMEIFKDQLK